MTELKFACRWCGSVRDHVMGASSSPWEPCEVCGGADWQDVSAAPAQLRWMSEDEVLHWADITSRRKKWGLDHE